MQPAIEHYRVEQLFQDGYTTVPIPNELQCQVRRSRAAFVDFLQKLDDERREWWKFAITDPGDPDEGLITRDGENGGDRKSIFQLKPFLPKIAEDRFGSGLLNEVECEFLSATGKLHESCLQTSIQVARAIDDYLGWENFSFHKKILEARDNPIATSHHNLRLLYYPVVEGLGSKGAGDHKDRSFLTIHIDGDGGDLYGIPDENTGEPVTLKHPPREALLFFGQKAEILTDGKVKALRHGSTTDGINPREAMVFFAHANHILRSTK